MSAQGSSGLFLGFAKIQECGGLYSWYQKMPRSSAERQLRVALLAGDVAFPSGPAAVGFSFLREGLQHYAGRLPCFWDTECLDKADAALTICSALPCSPRSSAICKGLIKAKQTFNKLLPRSRYPALPSDMLGILYHAPLMLAPVLYPPIALYLLFIQGVFTEMVINTPA